MIKVKGHDIPKPNITHSFERKAVSIQNSIVQTLKQLGIERDNVHLTIEKQVWKKNPATIEWYFAGRNLKYSYSLMNKCVDNLYIIDKVLQLEVQKLLSEEITVDDFTREFSSTENQDEQLKEARKTLGVEEQEKDFELISKKYKELAKKHHPDMPEGNHELFQKINNAHKLIKKELT